MPRHRAELVFDEVAMKGLREAVADVAEETRASGGGVEELEARLERLFAQAVREVLAESRARRGRRPRKRKR
ncbi:MAG: hypothetical protein M9894_20945 [Planctomycetes bacterium]|nr:hypothetical protein [Planctomycetota bacterium]